MSDKFDDVDSEVEWLKSALGYRIYIDDLDFLADDLERLIYSDEQRGERSYYEVASAFVEDAYYERGMLELLVKIHLDTPYRHYSFYQRIMERLVDDKRYDLIKPMWTSIIRESRSEYFLQHSARDESDPHLVEVKAQVLEAYDKFIGFAEEFNDEELQSRLQVEREQFEAEEFPLASSKPDPRKIDDALFWELITSSGADSQSISEHEALLGERLAEFKAPEIKRFQSMYCKLMKSLYHWNVWALAYAARDGCSDYAFEGFRSWLILKGDPDLIDLAINAPDKAAKSIEKDPLICAGHLLHTIGGAYQRRKGEPLKAGEIDLSKPKGRIWPEDRLVESFPELADYYKFTG